MNAYTIEKLTQLAQLAATKGLGVMVTSDDRTNAQQQALYTGPNPYPVAAPGTSQHEYGFAFDAVPYPDSKKNRATLGSLAKKVGLYYGGTKDPVHFQAFSKNDWTRLRQSPQLLSLFTSEVAKVTFKGVKFPATIPGLVQGLAYDMRPSPAGVGLPAAFTSSNSSKGTATNIFGGSFRIPDIPTSSGGGGFTISPTPTATINPVAPTDTTSRTTTSGGVPRRLDTIDRTASER